MRKKKSGADSTLNIALDLWKEACGSHGPSLDRAQNIYRRVLEKRHELAAGWSALACGRAALYSGNLQLSEEFLREASGRFHIADDAYGQGLVDCHIGIVLSARGQFERAIKFINSPLNSGVAYAPLDKALVHSSAAHFHWMRQDYHLAIAHLFNEFGVAKAAGCTSRYATTLANLGALLLDLNELELSLLASRQAWELQVVNSRTPGDLQLGALANAVLGYLYLGRLEDAGQFANLLWDRLNTPGTRRGVMPWLVVTEALGALHDADRARAAQSKARAIAADPDVPIEQAMLKLSEASLHEASSQFELAILAAKAVQQSHGRLLSVSGRMGAAWLCSRSYAALGNGSEAKHWSHLANRNSQRELLDRMLISQIRTTLIEDQALGTLTLQELNCLNLSAQGQSSVDIGQKLGIKPRTVNFHFSNILRKLNASNRQEAIAKAMRANLISSRGTI